MRLERPEPEFSPHIAIRIGITTPAKHEAANIKKCLDAGFEEIYMVALSQRRLEAIKAAWVPVVSAEQLKRVKYSLAAEFYENLDGWADSRSSKDAPDPKRPRKQKFEFLEDSSPEEKREIEKVMLKRLSDAMKGKQT